MKIPQVAYKISSFINIVVGIIAIIIGITSIYVYQYIFKGFYNLSDPKFLNTIGIGIFTSGFLFIAIPALAVGVLYIFVGFKFLNKPRTFTILMAVAALIISIFLIQHFIGINNKESRRTKNQVALQNAKRITGARISSSDNTGMEITYEVSKGTKGTYLIQTEIITIGQDDRLYFNSFEKDLNESDNSFTHTILFSELVEACKTNSDNWICTGLTNETVSLENLELVANSKSNLIKDGNITYMVPNLEYILDPDAMFTFELMPGSTLEDIRLVN